MTATTTAGNYTIASITGGVGVWHGLTGRDDARKGRVSTAARIFATTTEALAWANR